MERELAAVDSEFTQAKQSDRTRLQVPMSHDTILVKYSYFCDYSK